ncbi:transglycosylase family protein [Streptomyces hypolithicus]
MRSGNGRHRRPRQAPALVVAAGVAGSAIAIPLLGATGANAAEVTTWDRVADCESGGMWSADLDNGFYGGLQISQETWSSYGGTAYAPRADLASRSQQVKIAEKILAAQGPQAWPSCALITGLTDSDKAAPAGGSAATPSPGETWAPEAPDAPADGKTKKSDGTDSTDGTESTEKNGDEPPKRDASEEPAEPARSAPPAQPSASDDAPAAEAEDSEAPADQDASSKGKHRGEEAPEGSGDVIGESGEKRESGRHASRGDASTRDGSGTGAAPGVENAAYTVRAGDNLWAIADAHEVPGGWPALYEANDKALGSDPDLIIPGQSLDLG